MFEWLIARSIDNRLLVLLLSAALFFVGGLATLRMPVDVFPDLTAPTVTILAEGRGMAPDEMETLVTFPIEAAINGASDVRRVRSATAVGASSRPVPSYATPSLRRLPGCRGTGTKSRTCASRSMAITPS